ncbi:MAG TPA: Rv2175c family DNA-binding protein [Micromonosporaceae bacterium]
MSDSVSNPGSTVDATGALVEPAGWLTLPDIAEMLDVKITKVHQLIRERTMLAVRTDGVLRVPSEFLANDTVRKHLPGVLNLLLDAGYNDEEAMRWLFTEDPTLPGTPATALAGPRATEVKRRAQALGF